MNPRSSTKHGDELLARIVMQAALDAPVANHDDGSRPGMYDLEVQYPDGRRAAAEVVSTRDPRAWELSDASAKLRYQLCRKLTRLWIISVDPGARVRDLAKAAPALLAKLEQAGVERVPRTRFRNPWWPDLHAFGVIACSSMPPTDKHPPGFYILPAAVAAFATDGDSALHKAEAFLKATQDVPAKLRASGLEERHAILLVTHDWLGPQTGLEDDAIPTLAPELPQGIDCLWLIVHRSPPTRAVYWLGDGEWREVVVDQEQAERLTATS